MHKWKYCLIIRSKMLTPMFDSLSGVKRVASVLLSSPANSCTMLVVLRLVVAWAMSLNEYKDHEIIIAFDRCIFKMMHPDFNPISIILT